MQFQSDILDIPVERPEVIESTAMGAAYLAGLQVGLWTKEDILQHRKVDRIFEPSLSRERRETFYRRWQKAVRRTMNWENNLQPGRAIKG